MILKELEPDMTVDRLREITAAEFTTAPDVVEMKF